jgi:hypothetical protein
MSDMASEERGDGTPAQDEERSDLTTADLAGRTRGDETADATAQTEDTAPERQAESGEDLSARDEPRTALFAADETERFQGRWSDIQAGFVDRPREMVEQADTLVAELMQRLASQFSEERGRLETQWDKDENVSTEELRVALTRYRSFFERLLKA